MTLGGDCLWSCSAQVAGHSPSNTWMRNWFWKGKWPIISVKLQLRRFQLASAAAASLALPGSKPEKSRRGKKPKKDDRLGVHQWWHPYKPSPQIILLPTKPTVFRENDGLILSGGLAIMKPNKGNLIRHSTQHHSENTAPARSHHHLQPPSSITSATLHPHPEPSPSQWGPPETGALEGSARRRSTAMGFVWVCWSNS